MLVNLILQQRWLNDEFLKPLKQNFERLKLFLKFYFGLAFGSPIYEKSVLLKPLSCLWKSEFLHVSFWVGEMPCSVLRRAVDYYPVDL